MIPTSWKQITIAQFHAANKVFQSEYEDAIEQHIALLAAVSSLTYREIVQMSKADFLQAIKSLSFLNNLNTISTKFPKYFMLKGRLYKPLHGFGRSALGQDIDFRHATKGTEADMMANMHKILATMILPCTWYLRPKRYNGAKIGELSELFLNNLTMDIAYPMALFFCKVLVTFWQLSQDYIQDEMMEMMNQSQSTPSLKPTV